MVVHNYVTHTCLKAHTSLAPLHKAGGFSSFRHRRVTMKTGYPPREEAGQVLLCFVLFFCGGGVPEGKSGREGAQEQRRTGKLQK